MKKTIIVFLVLFGFFITYHEVSAALEVNWPNSPLGTELNEDAGLDVLIKYLYDWGVGLGGLAAFIALVIAGFQYLTSAGNPTKMKDAMDRIKSAGFGLILLLGSFLILNIINPQLTKLRIPEFSIKSGEWDVDLDLPEGPQGGDCDGVQLYSGTNYSSLIVNIPPIDEDGVLGGGQSISNLNREVRSVKFLPEDKSSCQLTLYRLTGFKTNADNPPLTIIGSVKDMDIYGETSFGSAKVINYQY